MFAAVFGHTAAWRRIAPFASFLWSSLMAMGGTTFRRKLGSTTEGL